MTNNIYTEECTVQCDTDYQSPYVKLTAEKSRYPHPHHVLKFFISDTDHP